MLRLTFASMSSRVSAVHRPVRRKVPETQVLSDQVPETQAALHAQYANGASANSVMA